MYYMPCEEYVSREKLGKVKIKVAVIIPGGDSCAGGVFYAIKHIFYMLH